MGRAKYMVPKSGRNAKISIGRPEMMMHMPMFQHDQISESARPNMMRGIVHEAVNEISGEQSDKEGLTGRLTKYAKYRERESNQSGWQDCRWGSYQQFWLTMMRCVHLAQNGRMMEKRSMHPVFDECPHCQSRQTPCASQEQ